MAESSRIILPGLSAEEERSKRLAMLLLQASERELYSNREILGACAIFAACTIKARYTVQERELTFREFVGMARNVMDQL